MNQRPQAELAHAALVGFDRRELITIPPLGDATQWSTFEGRSAGDAAELCPSPPG